MTENNNQIYQAIGELRGDVNSLKENTKNIQESLDNLHKLIHKNTEAFAKAEVAKDLEDRIAGLEKWRWLMMGGFTVVVFLANALADKIKSLFGL